MAFVHLHNHTVYSMLDGATRIKDMVSRAVELGMPAVAITDHGYMYGVPELGLACDAVNHGTPEYKVWSHDKSFLEKGRRDELECPDQESDPRGYEQHMKDLAMWDEKGNICLLYTSTAAVRAAGRVVTVTSVGEGDIAADLDTAAGMGLKLSLIHV